MISDIAQLVFDYGFSDPHSRAWKRVPGQRYWLASDVLSENESMLLLAAPDVQSLYPALFEPKCDMVYPVKSLVHAGLFGGSVSESGNRIDIIGDEALFEGVYVQILAERVTWRRFRQSREFIRTYKVGDPHPKFVFKLSLVSSDGHYITLAPSKSIVFHALYESARGYLGFMVLLEGLFLNLGWDDSDIDPVEGVYLPPGGVLAKSSALYHMKAGWLSPKWSAQFASSALSAQAALCESGKFDPATDCVPTPDPKTCENRGSIDCAPYSHWDDLSKDVQRIAVDYLTGDLDLGLDQLGSIDLDTLNWGYIKESDPSSVIRDKVVRRMRDELDSYRADYGLPLLDPDESDESVEPRPKE